MHELIKTPNRPHPCSSQGMEPDCLWSDLSTERNSTYRYIVTDVDYKSIFVMTESLREELMKIAKFIYRVCVKMGLAHSY